MDSGHLHCWFNKLGDKFKVQSMQSTAVPENLFKGFDNKKSLWRFPIKGREDEADLNREAENWEAPITASERENVFFHLLEI